MAAGQGGQGRRSDHEAQPGTEAGATKCLDGPGRVRTGHIMESRGAAGVRRAWLAESSRPFFGGSPSACLGGPRVLVDGFYRIYSRRTLQAR